jgi:hypothetical protein
LEFGEFGFYTLFLNSIANIVPLVAKKKMFRLNANTIIAPMKNGKIFRNWSMGDLVRKTMSAINAAMATGERADPLGYFAPVHSQQPLVFLTLAQKRGTGSMCLSINYWWSG